MVLRSKGVQSWARRLHIYISMALLFVVLFFSITGITLNRPDWFVSNKPTVTEQELSIPSEVVFVGDSFKPNQEGILRYLQQHADIAGHPSALDSYIESKDRELIEAEISFDYKGPGFSSSVFIEPLTQNVRIETTHYGLVAVLNDLHKGRNTGEIWKWFIDITALLMVVFVLTGVCLLLPKRKSLQLALRWTAFGSVISLAVFFLFVP